VDKLSKGPGEGERQETTELCSMRE